MQYHLFPEYFHMLTVSNYSKIILSIFSSGLIASPVLQYRMLGGGLEMRLIQNAEWVGSGNETNMACTKSHVYLLACCTMTQQCKQHTMAGYTEDCRVISVNGYPQIFC